MLWERKTLAQLRDISHEDPGAMIEECGAVVEALDAILDGLQRRLGKKDLYSQLNNLERIERQIEQFYSNGDLPHGGKLLNWYFSVEGDRAIRLALSILERIRTHQEWGYPETFRNISKLVFGWLRKSDPPCTWYWNVPEFRPFLIAHMPTHEGQTVKPPKYWEEDFEDGGWPTLQRVIREILAQKDASMLEALEKLNSSSPKTTSWADIPFLQPEEMRGYLEREERRWFIASATEALRDLEKQNDPAEGELRHGIANVLKQPSDGVPYFKVELYFACSLGDPSEIKPGDFFQIHLVYGCPVFSGQEKFWETLEHSLALVFIPQGIEMHSRSVPSWNSFENVEGEKSRIVGKRCVIPLTLKSPVGRIRIGFARVGAEGYWSADFYVGALPQYVNAAWRHALERKQLARA